MLKASGPPGDGRKAAVADRRSRVAGRKSPVGERRTLSSEIPLCLHTYSPYLLTYHTLQVDFPTFHTKQNR